MAVYPHRYPTHRDTPSLIFYSITWFLVYLMLNYTLSYLTGGVLAMHPFIDAAFAVLSAYVTVYFNKQG